MYIAPEQGQTTPWGQNFDVNRNSLSLCPIVASLKRNLFEVWFFTIFYLFFFSHVYSPRQGQTTNWGQNVYDNREAFSLCPYVASFKMISSKSDFIHILNDFIHVYSSGARAEYPLGTNFWWQQKALITSTICCKFQTNPYKGIEFIDLPSIFKDRSVTSSIPTYFQNSEPPKIVIYITSPLETLYFISIN